MSLPKGPSQFFPFLPSRAELRALSPIDPKTLPEPELDVSLLIPARNSGHALEKTTEEAYKYLSARFGRSFEIILIPNPGPENPEDPSTEIAESLARRLTQIRVCPHLSPRGKGAALRTGFLASKGRWIFFTDADLPYDLSFFDRASEKLRSGYDLVTGNRRLPFSEFDLPVSLLRIAYGRHRLGLLFNAMVRKFLPVRTTDTQAGIKAMSRELAIAAFSSMRCPGFFFDLEIFLSARGHSFRQVELPVTLYLNSEKSTVHVLREGILALFWLSRIAWNTRRGIYGKTRTIRVLSLYPRDIPLGTRFFLWLRWLLTPYAAMASYLPPRGRILDLGCGHGLLSLALSATSPERQVLGIDHDAARIALAKRAGEKFRNLTIEAGSMTDQAEGSFDGIAMIDVMHYFDPAYQRKLAESAMKLLAPGGTLIVREVEPDGGLASAWNRLYERIATGIGFTQAEKKNLHFRRRLDWEAFFRETGFRVRSEPCSSALFADILYICERGR